MKKSVKILIVVLCLIIVGLVTFIVVDRVINTKKEDSINNKSNNVIVAENNNNEIESNNTTSTNDVKNEEKTSNSSGTESNANINKDEVANKAIREALKDKNWIINNILPVMLDGSSGNEEWYNSYNFTFEKIDSSDIPTYIIQAEDGYSLAVIVSYRNGKVMVSEKYIEASAPGDENEQVTIDLKNGIARELPDSYDTQYNIYKINNGEFEPILNWDFGELVNGIETRNYFYEGKKIDAEDYSTIVEEYSTKVEEYNKKYNFDGINKKLTEENIDKYVK